MSVGISLIWLILVHAYIEINNNKRKAIARNYITKCSALGDLVEQELKVKREFRSQSFYDKVNITVVKECIKLEIVR